MILKIKEVTVRALLVLPLALLMACGDTEEVACELELPAAYPAADFATSAAEELALRQRLSTFTQPMKDAEADLAVKPAATELQAGFAAGEPSLASVTSTYYAGVISGLVQAFAASAGETWAPADPPPATGGKFGSYIFAADGRDIRQHVEKGLFGAAFYNRAAQLAASGDASPATVDRIVALFGSSPEFPAHAEEPATPDVLAAVYTKRRSAPGDAQALYPTIRDALIEARTAAAQGPDCDVEREQALQRALQAWEKALFATVIYYAADASAKLQKAEPTEADVSSALHGLGEAAGFVHGFRQLAQPRLITDAAIDELLVHLRTPVSGEVTVARFATDTAASLPALQQLEQRIAAVYGFDATQVAGFKVSH